MFQSQELNDYLKTSSSISVSSLVIAEWNMNVATNIAKVGNYRYRPTSPTSTYGLPLNQYDPLDSGRFYTDATFADTTIDGGFNDDDTPLSFTSIRQKDSLLFSLEDCLYSFRPRSGINKARYLDNRYLHHSNSEMARRPRYYMPDKGDSFRYWTSYRTETQELSEGQIGTPAIRELGIANEIVSGRYYIEDACPFVVYKNMVPANRIVVKMQTHVGDIDLGPFKNASGTFSDPLYGIENQQTPKTWKIQYLENNSWVDAISFSEASTRIDGTPIIGTDGYVELVYGLILPDFYAQKFKYFGELLSEAALPETNIDGAGYLIRSGSDEIGYYKIYDESISDYSDAILPRYGWRLHNESLDSTTPFVTDLTDPPKYYDSALKETRYREFSYIQGIRIVVDTMNKFNSTFDLIEMSPRLAVNVSDKIAEFSITKSLAEMGNTNLPLGGLLASTGQISIFDYDLAFSSFNNSSIIKDYVSSNIQFKFYEVTLNVNGIDYYIPIKTLYSEGFPEFDPNTRSLSIAARDLYFYFESLEAPRIFVQNVSLSYAVALLLDSIGFSNYAFFRLDTESDPIIPNFFVPPDATISSVLEDLAMSTQCAMFFDEYNNFVVMTKEYLMASESQRETALELSATKDFAKDGLVINQATSSTLSNIVEIASAETEVFNSGKVLYTSRYIQKSYGSLDQSNLSDRDRTWLYKPVLLWEAGGTDITKSRNNEGGNSSSYVLSAIPLATDLSTDVPYVENGLIKNNILNLGEGTDFISRYQGYFFANGEIIKYDAVEFSISGPTILDENGNPTSTKWIQSSKEYEDLFSKLAFNGKIFPTGRVRIYCEPNYETVDGVTRLSDGAVAKHGRGQFGTRIVNHPAGLSSHWTDPNNARGFRSSFKDLVANYIEELYDPDEATRRSKRNSRYSSSAPSYVNNQKPIVGGVIKNFLSKSSITETEALKLYTPETGTIQSSALVLQGPSASRGQAITKESPNNVSLVLKELDSSYKHFGARMRIVGKIESSVSRGQTPSGSSTYYTVPTVADPTKSVSIGGGSGGIGIFVNSQKASGYFLEIVALTETNISAVSGDAGVYNVLFWKVPTSGAPRMLYAGLTKILVDNGIFTGQYRIAGEESPTVYDIAIEHRKVGSSLEFSLYLNNQNIATVTDESPLKQYNNVATFVRGNARVMFENLYALSQNYSEYTGFDVDTPINSVFGDNVISVNEAFRKYAMSGMVQATYLSGISSNDAPKYNMYFEEFGTIMREAAYFNVEYDKAYPALYAKITPSFNRIKGYTVSGFRAGSYGAEFLVFNNTDTLLPLDSKRGTALTIQGVTFTSSATNQITVDDYFDKLSDFSNPEFLDDLTVRSPNIFKEEYQDIKNSRITHGKREFSISGSYIQDYDTAFDLMSWIIPRVSVPRLSLGVSVFGTSTLQLGDIVTLNFNDENGSSQLGIPGTRFVVYHMEYAYSYGGPVTTVYLSEVI